MTPSQALRRIVRYLLLGLAVIVTAFVVAFAQQQSQVEKLNRLAGQNRQLITQVDQLNRTQAAQAYQECVGRNARARASLKGFKRLVAAHRRDGDRNAERVWRRFLADLAKRPIPPCKKPAEAG